MKYLIINADDFGYSKVFNVSILELTKSGFISSTTVMVNWIGSDQSEQVAELIKLAKSHNLGIGLHLEFTDQNYAAGIKEQFNTFVSLFGFPPSHLDIHKHSQHPESFAVVEEFCIERKIPCRNNIHSTRAITTTNEVLSGTAVSSDELRDYIAQMKDNESYEILFHPGTYDPESKSTFNKEREGDLRKIKELNSLLQELDIQLINFNELAKPTS